jgi:hypothetical protein
LTRMAICRRAIDSVKECLENKTNSKLFFIV